MKASLPKILAKILALALLIATALPPAIALSQSVQPADHQPSEAQSEVEDDEPLHRVARLSFVQGEVSFLRAGVDDWAAAVENLPLLAGDQVYAGRGARAEIQLGRGNYLRLSENTALMITDLSQEAAQFELTEGIAIIRLERFGAAFQRFEVDTPNAALVLEQDGLYRIDVRGDEQTEAIVRRGLAEVTTADGNFRVREGHSLSVDSRSAGRLEIAVDTSQDDWDRWSYDRDTYIDNTVVAASPDYVTTYETSYNDFYGASELSHHGSWTNIDSYGHCWVPRVSSDWAPYRYGQWLWIPRAGWTWIAKEAWGWAPYHYGRWVHVARLGWAWVPGFGSRHSYGRKYYQWRPALVYFFNCPTPRGSYIGWYPLAPGQRWRRPGNYARAGWQRPDDDRRGRGGNDRDDRRARRPDQWHGVSVLPVSGFARGDRNGGRVEAPARDLHQWIDRNGRPDLPVLNPDRAAARPRPSGDSSDGREWRAIRPPSEILKRPIITRNRPTDPQVESIAPRERRVVAPPKGGRNAGAAPETRSPRDTERKDRGDRNSDSNRDPDQSRDANPNAGRPQAGRGSGDGQQDPTQSPRLRPRRPPSGASDNSGSDSSAGAASESGRKKDKDKDKDKDGEGRSFTRRRPPDAPRQNEDKDKDDSAESDDKKQRRRSRPAPSDQPQNDGTSRKDRDQADNDRSSKPPEAERPRRDGERANPDSGEAPKAREPRHERPQPRHEPSDQSRQERREEKREQKRKNN
jgi:hypothetical protein